MELKGKVHEVGAVTQVSESVTKREVIIEYVENPQYPEYLKFEMINDKTKLFDNIREGSDVEVFFNLRGRPWTDKQGKKVYFNSMHIWKVNVLSASTTPQYTPPADINSEPEEDDLPF